jgi:uncharacterized protein YprB with RNaseH-like and TPR domain
VFLFAFTKNIYKMLAFDIETEGLDSRFDEITVACIYDGERGIKRTFNFAAAIKSRQKHDELKEAFLQALDEAETLCCFNGIRFDIPFICRR